MTEAEILRPQVYRVTVTEPDGTSYSEVHGWDASSADHMVNRFIRKGNEQMAHGDEPGYEVIPATGASGALTLRRRNLRFGRRDGEVLRGFRTWLLVPVHRPKLSDVMYDDLMALRESTHHPRDDFNKPRTAGGVLRMITRGAMVQQRVSCSGMHSIPPAAWRLLVDRGWVSLLTGRVEAMTPVRVTVAGAVALALADHQTRTTEPGGYVSPSSHSNPDIAALGMVGRHGRTYDGSSWAVCSGGCLSGSAHERRQMAQETTRRHRAEMVLRYLGASEALAQWGAKRAAPRGREVGV